MQAFAEWVLFTCSGISSGLYHACDVGTWCALSFGVLQVYWLVNFHLYKDDVPLPQFAARIITWVLGCSLNADSKIISRNRCKVESIITLDPSPLETKHLLSKQNYIMYIFLPEY